MLHFSFSVPTCSLWLYGLGCSGGGGGCFCVCPTAATMRAAIAQAVTRWRMVLDFPLLHLVGEILRCSHRKRKNRHRRILRSACDEAAAIDHEQILDVVALVPLVQHACLRV